MFKSFTKLIAVGLMTISFGFSAQAETLTYSAGIPTAFTGDTITVSDISGTMIHVKFPGFVGFGFESYEATVGTGGFKTTMLDIFYLLPIPLVNVTLGAGAGQQEAIGTDVGTPSGAVAQAYLQFGWSFGLMDIHISQHLTKGGLAAGPLADTSGSMTAVGIQIGF